MVAHVNIFLRFWRGIKLEAWKRLAGGWGRVGGRHHRNAGTKNTSPQRGARHKEYLNLASLQDAVFYDNDFQWCRSPSLAQPPAKFCQAFGLPRRFAFPRRIVRKLLYAFKIFSVRQIDMYIVFLDEFFYRRFSLGFIISKWLGSRKNHYCFTYGMF